MRRVSYVLLVVLIIPHYHKTSGQQFTANQLTLLQRLQHEATLAGLPEWQVNRIMMYDSSLCYTADCLESALEIVSAANFSVDPCENWIGFVCARRVFGNGKNKLGQLAQLAEQIEEQTKALLETEVPQSKDFLLAEAQAYYHQCKNKGVKDGSDAQEIFNYVQNLYGTWPIFYNVPSEDFPWLEMVADMNQFERPAFQPLFLKIVVPTETPELQVDVGLTSLPITSDSLNDHFEMIRRIQMATGFRSPAITTQIPSMLEFMSTFSSQLQNSSAPQQRREVLTISQLQKKTEAYLTSAGIPPDKQINWRRFLHRVLFHFEKLPRRVVIDFEGVMETIVFVHRTMETDMTKRTAIVNALYFNMVSFLLRETTSLLDNLPTFTATEQLEQRETKCLEETQDIFGFALSKSFFLRHYDDARVTPVVVKMITNMLASYSGMISNMRWMSPETKSFVINKLNSIRTYIGQTQRMVEPNGLQAFFAGLYASKEIEGSHPLNFMAVTRWATAKKRSWSHKSALAFTAGNFSNFDIQDQQWNEYLGLPNAAYSRLTNQALINVGIMQKPLFAVNQPGFMNYGGLGMVLAHEIGHSLDTQGAKYDGNGKEGMYWDRTSALQYSFWATNIAFVYGHAEQILSKRNSSNAEASMMEPTNRFQTLDEDIADSIGIYISFYAYLNHLRELGSQGRTEVKLPGLQGLSPLKLLYMKYGNMWCENKEGGILESGPHSQGMARATLPIKISAEFRHTFGCRESVL